MAVMMTSPVRKGALTAHLVASLGWLATVAVFFVLAIAGAYAQDPYMTRAAYLAMDLITRWLIVPAALASTLTGIVSSLGTRWGLFRQYWVIVKLVITALATAVLLVHVRPIEYLAAVAASGAALDSQIRSTQLMLMYAPGAAVVALLLATVLSTYKPRGVTNATV
jgi:hypothetical protein